MSANDAVDCAHSAASECHRMGALSGRLLLTYFAYCCTAAIGMRRNRCIVKYPGTLSPQ